MRKKPWRNKKTKADNETDQQKKDKILKESAKDYRIEKDKYDSIKNLQLLLKNKEKAKLKVSRCRRESTVNFDLI